MAFAIGDLVVFDGFLDLLARSEVRCQLIGEFAVRLDVKRAIGAGDIGHGAGGGRYVRAVELTEEKVTVVTGDVVVENVAADRAAFIEAVGIVDCDRLDLAYALDVQGEQADVGVTGAIGDLVGDLLLQNFAVGEAHLGSIAQNIGVAAVRLDEERAVITLDFGDLAVALFGADALLVEETKEQIAVRCVIRKKISRNYIGF